jgi:hypothetical protein
MSGGLGPAREQRPPLPTPPPWHSSTPIQGETTPVAPPRPLPPSEMPPTPISLAVRRREQAEARR